MGSTTFSGPGFAGLTQTFGWPEVTIWPVWHAEFRQTPLAEARYATRSITAIAPYSDLSELRAAAVAAAQAGVTNGALAAVAAFEPTRWSQVRFALWRSLPAALPGVIPASETQTYVVGHVSLPRSA